MNPNSTWNKFMALTKRFSSYLLAICACLISFSIQTKNIVQINNDSETALSNIFDLTETSHDETLIEKTLKGMKVYVRLYRVDNPIAIQAGETKTITLSGLSPRTKIIKLVLDCKAGILSPLLKQAYKKLALNMLPAKIIMQFRVDESINEISLFNDIVVNQILNYDYYAVPAVNYKKGLYLKIYFTPKKNIKS